MITLCESSSTVERHLPKVVVASSNLVFRSKNRNSSLRLEFHCPYGFIALLAIGALRKGDLMVKKFLSVLLIFLMCICLFACEKSDSGGNTDGNTDGKSTETLDDGTEKNDDGKNDEKENSMKIVITLDDDRTIKLELYPEIAPISVANFLSLVDSGHYTNTIFHRVIEGFMIQTGWLGYNGENLFMLDDTPTIKGEFSENGVKNELSHTAGTISMARSSNMDSASAQFFICSDDSRSLDGKYAAFGRVLGEDDLAVVRAISQVPNGRTALGGINFDNFPFVVENGEVVDLLLIRIKSIARMEE